MKNKQKMKRLEGCCQELTAIAKTTSDNQHDIKMVVSLLEQRQDAHEERSSGHEDKEDKKNKWIYEELKAIDRKYNSLNNKFIFFIGAGAVLLLLFKFLDIGITVTQGK